MGKNIKNLKDIKKCAICGRTLRYDFEINSGVCDTCQVNKKPKIKTFEQFNEKQNEKI